MKIIFTFNKKIITLLLILIFLLFFSTIFSLININNNYILKNIYINNIDVSGLTKEQAISRLSQIINNKTSENITIQNYNKDEIKLNYNELDINYFIEQSVNEAYNIGRSNNIFYNNYLIINLFLKNKNLNIKYTIDNTKLENWINNLNENLENKLINSTYYIENSNLIITSGLPGNIIDLNTFKDDLNIVVNDISTTHSDIKLNIIKSDPTPININNIYNDIYKEPHNAYYEESPLKIYPEIIGVSFDKSSAEQLINSNYQDEYIIPLNITTPDITTKDLDIDIFQDELSSYNTTYNITNKERTNNLKLAANKINNIIISPGQEFSYNTVVGARTIEAGYKESKIYSNGKVIDGIGGGVCQISSTLYNAVFLANLNITERHNHQFLTSYVPAGRDATVSYGYKDFKFINNRTYPIKIELKVTNGIVYCNIYGLKENTEYTIDFDIQTTSSTSPQIIYEYDSSLNNNTEIIKQNGSNGITVNVYKLKKLDGRIISKELISQDTYNPLEKIILKNIL